MTESIQNETHLFPTMHMVYAEGHICTILYCCQFYFYGHIVSSYTPCFDVVYILQQFVDHLLAVCT